MASSTVLHYYWTQIQANTAFDLKQEQFKNFYLREMSCASQVLQSLSTCYAPALYKDSIQSHEAFWPFSVREHMWTSVEAGGTRNRSEGRAQWQDTLFCQHKLRLSSHALGLLWMLLPTNTMGLENCHWWLQVFFYVPQLSVYKPPLLNPLWIYCFSAVLERVAVASLILTNHRPHWHYSELAAI